jgi:hypothetical protein
LRRKNERANGSMSSRRSRAELYRHDIQTIEKSSNDRREWFRAIHGRRDNADIHRQRFAADSIDFALAVRAAMACNDSGISVISSTSRPLSIEFAGLAHQRR